MLVPYQEIQVLGFPNSPRKFGLYEKLCVCISWYGLCTQLVNSKHKIHIEIVKVFVTTSNVSVNLKPYHPSSLGQSPGTFFQWASPRQSGHRERAKRSSPALKRRDKKVSVYTQASYIRYKLCALPFSSVLFIQI